MLASGDPLCGSTVVAVEFQRYGLNDADQFALQVFLADGRTMIVRADPGPTASGACITTAPEPAAPLAELAALPGLALVAWKARRQAKSRLVRSCAA